MMAYTLIQAKPVSYGGTRALSSVKYIVIHYTAGNGDTALNEVRYFANGNTRAAGAHFFCDQSGTVYQSIPLNRVAWSVGGFYTKVNGAGTYYNICTNSNSVSIELCDNLNKDPSSKQISATKTLVAYIQSQCPNAKTIIRHWDVNGKSCPARMAGPNNVKWNSFKASITGGSVPTPAPTPKPSGPSTSPKWVGEVTADVLNVRTGPSTSYGNLKSYPKLYRTNLVDVCDTVNGWYYVRIAAKYFGYVHSAYLKKAGSSSSSGSSSKPATPAKKSIDQIANEVIQGKWGNGATRKQKLTAAGYNYSQVQAAVNKKLRK
jgi:N-acetylmuramoyl-L-alanine amidase CwlA